MSLHGADLHLCSCNGTIPLDRAAIATALELAGVAVQRSMLCQKELAAFAGSAVGDVVVACTQEAKLFGDVAEEGARAQTIRFVNIRETAGWSAEAADATPKIAALLALAGLARSGAGRARHLPLAGPAADRRPDGLRTALG